jgi:hypothetical protein
VARLIEELRYKPEGSGFDSRMCNWNFSLTLSFQSHYGPGVDSGSNRVPGLFPMGVRAAGA